MALLRAGELLLVFPEGYPNVDPRPTPKPDLDAFLPFRPGFARFAALAERDGRTRVPIVPVGFHYEHGTEPTWRIALRFGAPIHITRDGDHDALVSQVEERVRALSAVGGNGDGAVRG